jgi:chromosomal replication initiator protein
MSAFWDSCLDRLAQELPAQQFRTWICPLKAEESDAAGVRLVAPSHFVINWVRQNYLGLIEEHAAQFFSATVPVTLSCAPRKNGASVAPAAAGNGKAVASVEVSSGISLAQLANRGVSDDKRTERAQLRGDLTFETLVVGKSNEWAYRVARQVAENPGSCNPLFVYGSTGLGKTHLIHAIGNYVLEHNPDKQVRYVHVEDYIHDLVRGYKNKSVDDFKRYYRSLDVLLLDDVQFLGMGDKTASKEEFFYLFNSLAEAKKQIVITCDTYPKNINGLDDRLISRFDWGLTVDIKPPETEMRVAILAKKAESAGVRLDEEVAFLIARHLRSNVRELEGALNRVIAWANFNNNGKITLEAAREALKDIIGSVRQISIADIQKTVAEYYRIKVSDLCSKKRTQPVVRARQIAMWLAKEVTPFSYPVIGEGFDRDHTTVIHALKAINDKQGKDKQLEHDLRVLTQVLKT